MNRGKMAMMAMMAMKISLPGFLLLVGLLVWLLVRLLVRLQVLCTVLEHAAASAHYLCLDPPTS